MHFWGVTAQNEPRGNTGNFQDLVFTAQTQADFIRKYLGPVLRDYNPNLKIMTFDDQRAFLPDWAETVFGAEGAPDYIDGVAVHWYTSEEDSKVKIFHPFTKMRETHDKFPEKFILATEACTGYLKEEGSPIIGGMQRG